MPAPVHVTVMLNARLDVAAPTMSVPVTGVSLVDVVPAPLAPPTVKAPEQRPMVDVRLARNVYRYALPGHTATVCVYVVADVWPGLLVDRSTVSAPARPQLIVLSGLEAPRVQPAPFGVSKDGLVTGLAGHAVAVLGAG